MIQRPGVNRLSIFVGAAFCVVWLFYSGISLSIFGGPIGGIKLFWKYYFGGAVIAFLLPCLFIQGVAWVWRGFQQGKINDEKSRQTDQKQHATFVDS